MSLLLKRTGWEALSLPTKAYLQKTERNNPTSSWRSWSGPFHIFVGFFLIIIIVKGEINLSDMQSLVSHAVTISEPTAQSPPTFSFLFPTQSYRFSLMPLTKILNVQSSDSLSSNWPLFLHNIPSHNTVREQESKGTVHTLWLTHQPGSSPVAPHARGLLESPSWEAQLLALHSLPKLWIAKKKKLPNPENYKSIIFEHWIFSLLWERWVFLVNDFYSSRKRQMCSSRQVEHVLENSLHWEVFIAINYCQHSQLFITHSYNVLNFMSPPPKKENADAAQLLQHTLFFLNRPRVKLHAAFPRALKSI